MSRFTLKERPSALQWGALLTASLICVAAFELMRLPAALLLGAIAAAILVSWFEGRVRIPPWAFVVAQGFVGCLVARSITPDILLTIFRKWPMFLTLIGAVIFFADRPRLRPRPLEGASGHDGGLGLLPRRGDRDGADGRRLRRRHEAGRRHAISARRMRRTGGVDRRPGVVGLGRRGAGRDRLVSASRGRAFPRNAGAGLRRRGHWRQIQDSGWRIASAAVRRRPLSASHLLTITLPPWLLAICYALVGWSIGLRFTREIVLYAAKQLPRILASIFTLIAMCGGLAFALHEAAGTDALTAYLATSPGGADAVAIIAASSPVDIPFVMAMQIGRLLVVILIGPSLARMIARWTAGTEPASSDVQVSK